MSGLLEEFGVDIDDVDEVRGYQQPDDGIYLFEVTGHYVQHGTKADNDKNMLVFDYALYNEDGETAGAKREWYNLPADMSDPTPKEAQNLGRYKARLRDLLPDRDSVSGVGPDDVVGITGSLQLVTGKPNAQGSSYQNINNLRVAVGETESAAPAAAAPVVTKAAQPAARAAAAGVRPNPFPKK